MRNKIPIHLRKGDCSRFIESKHLLFDKDCVHHVLFVLIWVFFHRCFCRLALKIDMLIESDGLQTCLFIQINFEIYLYNGVIGNSYINNILMHRYIPAPKHIYCFISVWLSVFLSGCLFVRKAYLSHFSQTNTDIRRLTK